MPYVVSLSLYIHVPDISMDWVSTNGGSISICSDRDAGTYVHTYVCVHVLYNTTTISRLYPLSHALSI